MPELAIVVTCEHGGNQVPADYAHLFAGHEALLETHRGFDAGALDMARHLASAFDAPLHGATVTRLLVELNRSPGHSDLFSEISRSASPEIRRHILRQHYLPYREAVANDIGSLIAAGRRVLHLSSHSFTPVLNGETRNADIGLLYDPARTLERELCMVWLRCLQDALPAMKIRRNYPYTGRSDGFTAYLRKRHPAQRYLGIELEINQKHVGTGRIWRELCHAIPQSLAQAISRFEAASMSSAA